jgi:hypothetical protein
LLLATRVSRLASRVSRESNCGSLIAILPHDDGDRSIARDDLAAALGFAGSPRVNFEITHPESKSVRRARRCDAHVAASIVERRSKTFAHDDLESALIALSHATRAAE